MFKIADEISPLAIKIVADKNERSTRTLDAVRELAPKIRAAIDVRNLGGDINIRRRVGCEGDRCEVVVDIDGGNGGSAVAGYAE